MDEDIYNFDETGFAMDIIAIAKVITQADKRSRPSLVQPGNREWVIAIEAINASVWLGTHSDGNFCWDNSSYELV